MSDEDKKQRDEDEKGFDMYHFFSRWDRWLAILIVVLFLIGLTRRFLHGGVGI